MAATLASDFYLRERWDDFTEADPNERRAKIFADYLALGAAGRWNYYQAVKTGAPQRTLTPDALIAIESSRSTHERQVAARLVRGHGRTWVRISYDKPSLLDSLDEDEVDGVLNDEPGWRLPLLDDAQRYRTGTDWQSILLRVPELVDSYRGPQDPTKLQQLIQDARTEAEEELDGEDDEDARTEQLDAIHHAYVTGCFWVQDSVTDEAEHGEALLLWVDEFGRVVRESRTSALTDYMGLFSEGADEDSPLWQEAYIGEDYEAARLAG